MGQGVTSSNTTAPIFTQIATAALNGITPREFPVPDGIQSYQVCVDTGALFDAASCPSGESRTEIAWVQKPPPQEGFFVTREVDGFSGLLANQYCNDYVETRNYVNINDATAINWLNNNPNGQAWAAARGIEIPLSQPPENECQPGQPRPQLAISVPTSGQQVSGVFEVRGSVVVPEFASYQFLVDNLDEPGENFVAVSPVYSTQQPNPNGFLGSAEVSSLPSGNYALRVQGTSQSGATASTDVTIFVNNVAPTAIPTSTPQPTPTTDPFLPTAAPTLTPAPTDAFQPVPPAEGEDTSQEDAGSEFEAVPPSDGN
jgi:hypothetical protein